MISPRLLKIYRDSTSDYSKSILLVLAIAIGIFGIGTILGSYAVLKREMAGNYLGTNPATATLELAGDSISPALVSAVKTLKFVKQAERRATVLARMKVGNVWYPMLLFVVDDFQTVALNKMIPELGATVPPTGTMLVERTALQVMKSELGKSVFIKTPHGNGLSIPISGVVHDPGLAPAWQEQSGYGYISLATLHQLGEQQGFNQLSIQVDSPLPTMNEAQGKARLVADYVTKKGSVVHDIQVPPPGKHPHQGQMTAILTMFVVFSFMTLGLGSILVSTSIATLMVKQIREIGVMKTIGAGAGQIAGLYLVMILGISVLAVALGAVLSPLAAHAFIRQIARLLNLTIADKSIPGWVFMVQALAGILIPVTAALVPIRRGSRITIREALSNYGISGTTFGSGRFDRFLGGFAFFSDSFRLSIRNIFRHRSRLIMTLGLLAAGGGMFMTALNISDAWQVNLQKIYRYRFYDLEVRLSRPIETAAITQKILTISGVKQAEAWGYVPTTFVQKGTIAVNHTYPDKGHGSFYMLALPVPTQMVNFPVLAGRWLTKPGTNEVVLNHMAMAQVPTLKPGDYVTLDLDGKPSCWRIAGFVEDIGSPAVAYVSLETYRNLTRTPGLATMIRISATNRDKANVAAKIREIETLLAQNNVPVSVTIPISILRSAIAGHMQVLIGALLAMALLMGLVGALGLASTVSMNIMERTRELGVLRAIGATPARIVRIVLGEGMLIGALSLGFALLISLGLSAFLGDMLGRMSFRVALPLVISPLGLLIWVVIAGAGSALATWIPARRASRLPVHEALAYQ